MAVGLCIRNVLTTDFSSCGRKSDRLLSDLVSATSGLSQATLKKMLFPVERPSRYIAADFLFFQNIIIFLPKNKKEKKNIYIFCCCPTGHNFGHPLDRILWRVGRPQNLGFFGGFFFGFLVEKCY